MKYGRPRAVGEGSKLLAGQHPSTKIRTSGFRAQILQCVNNHPNSTMQEIIDMSGIGASKALAAARALIRSGHLVVTQ